MSQKMRKIQEVYVSHNTIGQVGHKVCIERVSRDSGDRTERWYGIPRAVVGEDGNTEWVERKVTQSSIKRLNQAMMNMHSSIRIEGITDVEWKVSMGILDTGMFIRLWR